MRFTRNVPYEFIIFTWLPFETPEGTGSRAQRLVERLRAEGWPFHLRCMLAEDAGALFPARFAWRRDGRDGGAEGRRGCRKRGAPISEADLSTFVPEDFESGDEESVPP